MNPDAVSERAALQRERAAELTDRLVDWLAPLDGSERVLDSGCGTGAFALAVAGHVGSVVGVDADAPSVAAGREAAPQNVELREGDATALAFAEATFDVGGCLRVLHHVPRPDRVVEELARVVRPGGRVLLVDQLRERDPAAAEANERFERDRDASHTHTLPRAEIRRLLERAGLEVVREEVVVERREVEKFLDLAGLTGARRDEVRRGAPAPVYDVEVGWFLARR